MSYSISIDWSAEPPKVVLELMTDADHYVATGRTERVSIRLTPEDARNMAKRLMEWANAVTICEASTEGRGRADG